MRDYTYQDMLKMQEDAAIRVREMKKRATVALEDEPSNNSAPLPDKVRHISYPVELPESHQQTPKEEPQPAEHTGIIDLLTKDKDAMLIIALLLVLYDSEDSDQFISLALIYLLL